MPSRPPTTSAKTDLEAFELLLRLGMPFAEEGRPGQAEREERKAEEEERKRYAIRVSVITYCVAPTLCFNVDRFLSRRRSWLRRRRRPWRVRRNLIEVEDGAPDRTCVPAGDAPVFGPEDALVTLAEFSGFECAACRDLEVAIHGVIGRHPQGGVVAPPH